MCGERRKLAYRRVVSRGVASIRNNDRIDNTADNHKPHGRFPLAKIRGYNGAESLHHYVDCQPDNIDCAKQVDISP